MQTETVAFVKVNANKLNMDGSLLVTQNAKAKHVVQSVKDYQYLQDSIALLKMVNLAERQCATNLVSVDDAFDL